MNETLSVRRVGAEDDAVALRDAGGPCSDAKAPTHAGDEAAETLGSPVLPPTTDLQVRKDAVLVSDPARDLRDAGAGERGSEVEKAISPPALPVGPFSTPPQSTALVHANAALALSYFHINEAARLAKSLESDDAKGSGALHLYVAREYAHWWDRACGKTVHLNARVQMQSQADVPDWRELPEPVRVQFEKFLDAAAHAGLDVAGAVDADYGGMLTRLSGSEEKG